MTLANIIAKRVMDLYKERRIPPNRLATMSGVPHSTLDNILHGRSRNPTLLTLMLIANAFCMTVSEFLNIPELNNHLFDDIPEKD